MIKNSLNVKKLVIIGSLMICLIMLILFVFSGVTRVEITKFNSSGEIEWVYTESDKTKAFEIEQAINSEEHQKTDKSSENALYEINITYNYIMKSSAKFNLNSDLYNGKLAVYGSENDFILPDESQAVISSAIEEWLNAQSNN